MKKFSFLLLIASIFIISCKKEQNTTTSFYIKNTSSNDVTIFIRKAEFQGIVKDTLFVLRPKAQIKNSFTLSDENNVFTSPFGLLADSATVVSQGKLYIYKPNDGKLRNILQIESYIGGKMEKEQFGYTYTLTDEDFIATELH